MLMHFKKIFLVLTTLVIAGCGGQSIDTTNTETFIASVQAIEKELPPEQAKAFTDTVHGVIIRQTYENDPFVAPLSADQARHIDKALYMFSGKSADEVLKLADKFKGAKPRAVKGYKAGTSSTQPKPAPATPTTPVGAASAPIEQASTHISIIESALIPAPMGETRYASSVQFVVRNDSTRPITAVLMMGSVFENGQQVHTEEFYHTFESPLNPGDVRQVNELLDPSTYQLPMYRPSPNTTMTTRITKAMDTQGGTF